MHTLHDYRYELPEERIAQTLADPPESCRLLTYTNWTIDDKRFFELPELITSTFATPPLICRNTTKVIPARLITMRDCTERGEILYLHAHDAYTFEAKCYPWKDFKVGRTYEFPEWNCTFEILDIVRQWRLMRCSRPIMNVLLEHGHLPLPPYIERDSIKESSYQPHIAKQYGSLAAPTATLHFTPEIFDAISNRWCEFLDTTLHIGLWTFQVVEHADIRDHPLHSEQILVEHTSFGTIAQAKLLWCQVLAIGTTVTRTLESLPALWKQSWDEFKWSFTSEVQTYRDELTKDIDSASVVIINWWTTQITAYSNQYIYPWVPIRIVDGLITNFHLPHSSLLMLVAGLVGYNQMRTIYDHALAGEYEFFSFGDAMLLVP